ncbi:hypothetical protein B296_00046478 [Ensete ventricosum]|uniref:Uncharacterized protein n=1 Tax=Ensete ventricosum TaxID=4639 RepID=A0A426WZ59_ENSVE|nr:hypothetical protein B296_00046478 [Ensete ventricosum]
MSPGSPDSKTTAAARCPPPPARWSGVPLGPCRSPLRRRLAARFSVPPLQLGGRGFRSVPVVPRCGVGSPPASPVVRLRRRVRRPDAGLGHRVGLVDLVLVEVEGAPGGPFVSDLQGFEVVVHECGDVQGFVGGIKGGLGVEGAGRRDGYEEELRSLEDVLMAVRRVDQIVLGEILPHESILVAPKTFQPAAVRTKANTEAKLAVEMDARGGCGVGVNRYRLEDQE